MLQLREIPFHEIEAFGGRSRDCDLRKYISRTDLKDQNPFAEVYNMRSLGSESGTGTASAGALS
jgi:hypothetical protein